VPVLPAQLRARAGAAFPDAEDVLIPVPLIAGTGTAPLQLVSE